MKHLIRTNKVLALPWVCLAISGICEARCHNTPVTALVWTQVLQYGDACEAVQPLKLARRQQSYPAMEGAVYEVDFWQGSFRRSALVVDTYRTNSYDSCSGAFVGWHEFKGPQREMFYEFSVENPNLGADVSTSYAAGAPMTDPEARAALAEAKVRCETAR